MTCDTNDCILYTGTWYTNTDQSRCDFPRARESSLPLDRQHIPSHIIRFGSSTSDGYKFPMIACCSINNALNLIYTNLEMLCVSLVLATVLGKRSPAEYLLLWTNNCSNSFGFSLHQPHHLWCKCWSLCYPSWRWLLPCFIILWILPWSSCVS